MEGLQTTRLDFQTRPDGWFLDDALVTTTAGATVHRTALSIKSNTQFGAATAPADFVEAIWTQWLGVGSTVFKAATDFMGIVTAPFSAAAQTSTRGLAAKILDADPNVLPARLATPHWASAEECELFASFACRAALATVHGTTDADTVRLLQHLHFRQHDFGDAVSASLENALQLCRRALRDGSLDTAKELWNALRSRAAELRPCAGHITRGALVEGLRAEYALADYPNHAAKLDGDSSPHVRLP